MKVNWSDPIFARDDHIREAYVNVYRPGDINDTHYGPRWSDRNTANYHVTTRTKYRIHVIPKRLNAKYEDMS